MLRPTGELRGPFYPPAVPVESRSVRRRLLYETAPSGSRRLRIGFYALFGGIWAALVATLGVFVIQWNHPASLALFGILAVLFLGGAYGLARQLTALVVAPARLPFLSELARRPRVALLYTTVNDVVPECLRAILQTYPVEVFVLDDSTREEATAEVDRIAAERGYTVLRRPSRRGFKAGAINDWLRQYGDRFEYFVLLDADSFLPADWVAESLRYAEHPANQRVAIFQGLINIWNFDTRFVQTLAPMARVGQYVWEERVANALDAVFCYGHNALFRTAAIREVGGIVEGFVSEDFATAVALADLDWHSRFVPLHSYEAMPENVRGFIKRQNKWTRGAMEFFTFNRRSRLPGSRKFHLLQTPLGHLTNLLLPVGMLLTVYGFSSTLGGAVQLLRAVLSDPLGTLWSIPLFRYLALVGLLSTVPSVLVLLRCRIGWRTYWHHRWLSAAVSVTALPYEALSMARLLAGKIRTVPVTPKSEVPLGPRDVLYLARYSLVMEAALLLGLTWSNPVGALFNFTWLVPMLAAPAILLHYSGGPDLSLGPSSTPVGAVEVPCRLRDPYGVHASLSQIRSTARLPVSWAGA